MKPYTLPLPADYRLDDVLAFHRRDPESIAEEVSAERLRKGVLLDGVPAVLDITLPKTSRALHASASASTDTDTDTDAAAGATARVTVCADAALSAAGRQQARDAVLNILGLRIDPAPFCAFVKKDKLFAALAKRQPGLRIVQSATVFEALTWAIIGQQINLSFAIALRRTFILLAGRQHSSGLWCYPDAGSAAALTVADLTSRKFSRAKAETLLRLAALVASDELRLEIAADNSIEQISTSLLAVKGIGPWTVNYGLLRGYGHADCSLHGDVAVRAALQTLLGEDTRPDIQRTEEILARYSPHRTMAAAHLWASLHPRD